MRNVQYLLVLSFLLTGLLACAPLEQSPQERLPVESPSPVPKFSTPVSPAEIRVAYYSHSVVAIVRALHENDEANWNLVLDKVESGDTEWINTFVLFVAPGTDAASSTAKIVALAKALPNNPEAVLQLDITGGPPLYQICTLPFIEPEYEYIKSYGEKTVEALLKVKKTHLLDPRDVCLRRLQESLERAGKLYREGRWPY